MKVKTMKTNIKRLAYLSLVSFSLSLTVACGNLDKTAPRNEDLSNIPASYSSSQGSTNDTTTIATQTWREYFADPNLVALIDSALNNNQELNIILQEIQITNNEVMARKGEYMPSLNGVVGAGVDKTPKYTTRGAAEEQLQIVEDKANPKAMPDLMVGVSASWEVDIWHKLRNAKQGAYNRFLATTAGKDFMVTNLVAEIANSYYELLALDSQLDIVKQNIEIQNNALNIVRLEKEATRVTELAVKKFEAEVYHTRSLQYDIQQKIIETENRINYLVGRYPQPVARTDQSFATIDLDTIIQGIPSQLLENRADIKEAELNLKA